MVYITEGPIKEMKPSNYYTEDQRLIVNPEMINTTASNLMMEDILENLPEVDVFNFEYIETKDFYEF